MLIHKDEIDKGALRNSLSLIYSTEGLSTHMKFTKGCSKKFSISYLQYRGTFYSFLDKGHSQTISFNQDFLEGSTKF